MASLYHYTTGFVRHIKDIFCVSPNLKIDNKKTLAGGGYVVHAIDFFNNYDNEVGLQNEATLIVEKQSITGIIRSSDSQIYELEPLGDGNYALIHIDSSQYPPDQSHDITNINDLVNFDWWNGERNFFIPQDAALEANGKPSLVVTESTRESAQKTNIALSLLTDNKRTLNLNLAPDMNFPVMFIDQELTKSSGYIWRGKIIDSRNGSVTLSVNGKKITGIIRTDAADYAIEPIVKSKTSSLVKINAKSYPPEHPTGNSEGTETEDVPKYDSLDMGSTADSADLSKSTTIDILVAYTPSARQAVTDINAHINLAVSEANQSYANSGIPIKLRLVNAYETNYAETGDFTKDLKRFRVNGDKQMDEVHAIRTRFKADVAVLLVNNNSSCGLAAAIMAKSNSAFAAVHYDCAVGNYSFAHEIGHLQGARHDKESGTSGTDKVCNNSAYGYLNTIKGWRTVMAYNNTACVNQFCARIAYWSNPTVNYQGDVTGESKKKNAACLIKTRSTVANFQ
jgi:hypothetical protein